MLISKLTKPLTLVILTLSAVEGKNPRILPLLLLLLLPLPLLSFLPLSLPVLFQTKNFVILSEVAHGTL